MNKCIKRASGGVMRISDYWLLEVVQQCQWVLKETNSNHSQNYRSKKILDRIRTVSYTHLTLPTNREV